VRLCYRLKGGICTKKRESLFLIQRIERRSEEVYLRADKEGVCISGH